MQKLVEGSTSNVIEVVRLRDSTTGDYISGATVTLESIKTLGGSTVSGQTYPATMDEVEPGRYRVTADPTLAVQKGEMYTINSRAIINGVSRDLSELALGVGPEEAP